MSQLKIGDKAPAFKGKDQDGNSVSLSDFKGKKLVIFFYPEDDTEVCTKEACNLRDNYSELKKKGYAVIGVSPDDEASHQKFIGKYKLPYTLIADPDKKILNAYEAWGEKNMYGNIVIGVIRKTYVIDEKGVITKIIKKVRATIHSEQILKEL